MTAPLRACAAGVACALAGLAGTAHAVAPAPTTEGHLVTKHGGEVVDVPLAHTDVHIRVDGMLVDATVTQEFRNPYADKIEAVYLFPLPTGAAVDDLVITSGDRTIHGQIAERAAATRTYEAARDHGQVAALLTEERPNLFTQNLANLEPGARVSVTLHYVQRLAYADDGYELVFPMVAPPRDVTRGSDVAALAPTTLPPTERSSADIGVDVELDAAVPITELASPSHQLVVTRSAPSRAHVTLAPSDTIPNKDFVLRYRVAGAAPALGALAYRGDTGDGTFVLVAQPPAATAAQTSVAPRELLLVLDTSSSMRGAPLAKGKELVRRVLATLRPDDTFQLVRFDDSATALAAAPIANTPRNVALAERWLAHLEAGGSTDVSAGFDTAFAQPHDALRLRVAVFIGDGYVGDEDAILARVTAELGTARLYCFGVGSAVNRYLLEELARLGRGALQVVRPDEDTAAATATFVRRIDAPVLTDVTIDWGGLPVADVSPAAAPDVFLGAPLVLAGHYAHGARGTITVHGTRAGQRVSLALPVELPEHDAARPAVQAVWARERIAELSRQLVRRADSQIEHQILALSLASHVLTRFTAFVAVDTSHATAGGAARKVAVPVEVPEAVQGIGVASDGVGYGVIGAGYGGGGSYGVGGAGLAEGAYGDTYGDLSSGFESTSIYGGVGLGATGTIGHGAGADSYGAGYGIGGAHVGMRGRVADPVTLTFQPPAIQGELDLAIVRRYLKRNRQKLQYCYEKALLGKPALAGQLVLQFAIGTDGLVTESTATGVDADVDTCAAAVVHDIEFPKPRSGLVQVRYPIQLANQIAEKTP
jgi:Ca-activated chloride channel family protein